MGGNGERRSDWNIAYIGPMSAANPEIRVEDARSKRPRVPTASEAHIASTQHGDVGMVRQRMFPGLSIQLKCNKSTARLLGGFH